jgi:hypothetical protein
MYVCRSQDPTTDPVMAQNRHEASRFLQICPGDEGMRFSQLHFSPQDPGIETCHTKITNALDSKKIKWYRKMFLTFINQTSRHLSIEVDRVARPHLDTALPGNNFKRK